MDTGNKVQAIPSIFIHKLSSAWYLSSRAGPPPWVASAQYFANLFVHVTPGPFTKVGMERSSFFSSCLPPGCILWRKYQLVSYRPQKFFISPETFREISPSVFIQQRSAWAVFVETWEADSPKLVISGGLKQPCVWIVLCVEKGCCQLPLINPGSLQGSIYIFIHKKDLLDYVLFVDIPHQTREELPMSSTWTSVGLWYGLLLHFSN